MDPTDRPVLVVGGTGFVGGAVVTALLAAGRSVRCLVRSPDRAGNLRDIGVEVVPGDMLDPSAVRRAAAGAGAVVISVHTLSRQPAGTPGADFTDVEAAGVASIVEACRAADVPRLVSVTSIGVDRRARSSWLRGRAASERALLDSGLAATVLRPGMVVGRGGDGFGMVERGARHRVAIVLAARGQRFRTIAVTDLAGHVVDVLDDPRTHGRSLDVGSDDVLSMDRMIDLAAEHLGRAHPVKVHLPRRPIAVAGPLLERLAGMPPGAVGGFVGPGSDLDLIGDVSEVRSLLPTTPRSYRDTLTEVLGPSVRPFGV